MTNSLMLKRKLLNLGLLAITIMLGLFVWYANRSNNSVPGQILMPELNPASIKRITIFRSHKPTLIFSRSSDGWQITSPLKARANSLLIQTLLALPQTHSHKHLSIKDKNLKKYGLNPPKAIISFDKKNSISLGNINSINKMRYALANKKLYLIQNSLDNLTGESVIKWISLSLLPTNSHIRELRLPYLTIHRNHQNKQLIIKPKTEEIAKKQLVAVLNNWHKARAYRITPINTKKENHPTQSKNTKIVKIILNSGKTYRFRIISTQPNLIIQNTSLDIDYHFPIIFEKKLLLKNYYK